MNPISYFVVEKPRCTLFNSQTDKLRGQQSPAWQLIANEIFWSIESSGLLNIHKELYLALFASLDKTTP